MFFPRLRKRAKWVFAFLALVFAVSFMFLGVGAGGSGIADYISQLFGTQSNSTGTPSIDAAKAKVKKDPKNAAAQLELANAYQAANRTDDAIAALVAYRALKPKDADVLQQLASLYLTKATTAEQRAQTIQSSDSGAFFDNLIVNPSSKFGTAIGQPQISELEQQKIQKAYSDASIEATGAHSQEADIWKELVALQPDNTSFLLELGRSNAQKGDLDAGLAAYKKFLAAVPDDPNADRVKEIIKAIEKQKKAQQAAAASSPTATTGG
jgi:cytochrome c-type biogenesis protein CcmH/NrfG